MDNQSFDTAKDGLVTRPKHYSEQKRFSLVARMRSMSHAFRGISVIVRTQHNTWIHVTATMLVILLGVYYRITAGEWLVLILAITVVLCAEAFNTAIEIDIDLTSPQYHPYARDTKDVAAGAVLITVCGAIIVGCIIFLPKIAPQISAFFTYCYTLFL